MMPLTEDIALVTGASRGIGQAIALALGRQGAKVVGTATTQKGANAIQSSFDQQCLHGLGLVLDVTDLDTIAAVMKQIGDTFGAPSILVNNAGITRDNLLMRMKVEEWQSVIDTNLTGLYRVVKPALRAMMKARWGRIINLSSVVARMGNPGQANYVASKAGIEGFSRSLALEVASRGITVNSVAPGFIATDMTSDLTPEQVDMMLARVPLGAMGAVTDIAAAVAFLASESAGYITGETLQVNGGLHMS